MPATFGLRLVKLLAFALIHASFYTLAHMDHRNLVPLLHYIRAMFIHTGIWLPRTLLCFQSYMYSCRIPLRIQLCFKTTLVLRPQTHFCFCIFLSIIQYSAITSSAMHLSEKACLYSLFLQCTYNTALLHDLCSHFVYNLL